jgi:hypothetical protein
VSAGQLAALIAAGFFAAGMCAAVFVLLRLARLISHANRILTDYSGRAGALIEHAQAAVERTREQLTRTDSITAVMDEASASMAELSGHVSALAGLARGVSAGFGAPLLRVAAFAFGVRRAFALRLPARAAAVRPPQPAALPPQPAALPRQNVLTAGPGTLPAGADALTSGRSSLPARRPGGLRRILPGQRKGQGIRRDTGVRG